MSNEGLNYHLFTNQATCQNVSVLDDFVEVDLTGYEAQNITSEDFTIQNVAGHQATIIASPAMFSVETGSVVVQGWYATDSDDEILMACSNFDTPQTLQLGSPVMVVPAFGDFSQQAF